MERKFLIGSRLHLRPLLIKDLKGNYVTWFDDKEVCDGNTHHVLPMSLDEMQEYVTQSANTNLVLAIIVSDNNLHIGNIALQNINYIHRTAEYAIIIGEKKYWGQGYSEEASELIIEHGFNALNLRRIYLGTFDTNNGMKRLAAKLGFKDEGRRREAVFKNGKYIDIIEYGLLKEEWLEK